MSPNPQDASEIGLSPTGREKGRVRIRAAEKG